jgi:hypothetical protein
VLLAQESTLKIDDGFGHNGGFQVAADLFYDFSGQVIFRAYYGIVKSADSKLRSLMRRIRKATARRGERVRLASRLGVPKQSVNDWLSGRKSPAGETTLRLLEWVTEAERKKTKRPGGAKNTTRAKTRLKGSHNETKKPGPIKS